MTLLQDTFIRADMPRLSRIVMMAEPFPRLCINPSLSTEAMWGADDM